MATHTNQSIQQYSYPSHTNLLLTTSFKQPKVNKVSLQVNHILHHQKSHHQHFYNQNYPSSQTFQDLYHKIIKDNCKANASKPTLKSKKNNLRTESYIKSQNSTILLKKMKTTQSLNVSIAHNTPQTSSRNSLVSMNNRCIDHMHKSVEIITKNDSIEKKSKSLKKIKHNYHSDCDGLTTIQRDRNQRVKMKKSDNNECKFDLSRQLKENKSKIIFKSSISLPIKSESEQNKAKREENQLKAEWNSILRQKLDHSQHSHFREEQQCFLSQFEVYFLLEYFCQDLKKQTKEQFLFQIWSDLEGQLYGGIASQNLIEFVYYIMFKSALDDKEVSAKYSNQKLLKINHQLKIEISQEQKVWAFLKYHDINAKIDAKKGIQQIDLKKGIQEIGMKKGKQQIDLKKGKQKPEGQVIKIIDESDDENEDEKESNFEAEKDGKFKNCLKASHRQNEAKQLNQEKKCIRIVKNKVNSKENVILSDSNLKSVQHQSTAKQMPDKKHTNRKIIINDSSSTLPSQTCSSQTSYSSSLSNGKQTEIAPLSSSQNLIQQILIKKPILSVDVNISEGLNQKLIIYEGETALQVSHRLQSKYQIEESMRTKFEMILEGYLKTHKNQLWKIDEVAEEMYSDRQQ